MSLICDRYPRKIMISVIVPIYNVEKYLPRCIESILEQSYGDYELILVDDGSSDSSGKICDDYAKIDRRIRVFHKKNGGVSDARNCGLDNSKGEYICFVDSDDAVGKDYLRIMYEMHQEANVDISIVSFDVKFDDNKCSEEFQDNRCILGGEEAFHEMLLVEKFSWSPWGKLYKRKMFEGKRFPKGYVYDDFYTIPYIIGESRFCAYSDSIQYHYYQQHGSLTHTMSLERLRMWGMGVDKLMAFTCSRYPRDKKIVEKMLINGIFDVCLDYLLDSIEYNAASKEIKNKYSMYLKSALKYHDICLKRKMNIILFLISHSYYRWIKRIWLRIKPDMNDQQNGALMKVDCCKRHSK